MALAQADPDHAVMISDLSTSCSIPKKFLEQILLDLKRHGLVRSKRGKLGSSTGSDFPGRRLLDAAVDLPFALPTAVAGIALAALYAPNGWIGALFAPWGIKIAFTPAGIFIALVFIGLPFVVRTVQPVLQDFECEVEEASATLGATRMQTVFRVVLPALVPALVTGVALAFARAVGEYGSVIFIAGNIPFVSEIAPLLIVTRLEEFDYAGASAIAVVMLTLSFVALLVINSVQALSRRRYEGA